jgi:prepilin-type N-terminal cleavage/methylation domain-containing protein
MKSIGEERTTKMANRSTGAKRPNEVPGAQYQGGFSLIEVVAVLAILALLATAMFSATTRSTSAAFSRAESATLQNFAAALQHAILTKHNIPGTNDWFAIIGDDMGMSANSVLYNPKNPLVPRLLLIDTNLALGPVAGRLPYTNGPAGYTAPLTNCRVMIVSSLGPSWPLGPFDFNALWSHIDGSPLTGSFSGWNPDDLKIQRIHLAPLFVRLALQNSTVIASNGLYKIDGFPAIVPNPGGINAYFPQGTFLDLLTDTGTTNARLILSRDTSYFYASSEWRSVPVAPSVPQTNLTIAGLAQKLSASAAALSSSPLNTKATVTPSVVVNDFSNFMFQYTAYAAVGSTNHQQASDAQNALATDMAGLVPPNTVAGGCANPP